MADLTGVNAHQLAPTGPGDLVSQLNAAAKRVWWPWVLLASFLLVIGTDQLWWLAVLVGLIGAVATIWVASLEVPRRKVEVTYDIEGPIADWFNALAAGWPGLTTLGGAWRIHTRGALSETHHRKTSAMASHLITRSPASFRMSAPAILNTNIHTPSISSGANGLYFLPDRVEPPRRVRRLSSLRL